ncbi:MAG: DUF3305 domain-containing protein [Gammaproteobacteria bacterium]|nr:DUF3305 domain-containing protein [Gammaproteobacteria bacterium]MBU1724698.1 DUF3305 domain-containing protein [Gammaproteobacteria bacterium]MBU2005020.1 DUF3305 domain-containing protein [Gammaproteobacteria bacterium]
MNESSLRDAPALPERLAVAAILEKRPSTSRWAAAYWTATGVVVGGGEYSGVTLLHEQDGVQQYLYPGLSVSLYRDECESYYHNLQAPQPGCYIIANLADDGTPSPFLVTLCFDAANSYLQGSSEVYAVPIPPELYRWTEAFVLEHYAPEQKKKRRLTDFQHDHDRGH